MASHDPLKSAVLARLFGVPVESVRLSQSGVSLGSRMYEIVDGVIILDKQPVAELTISGTKEDVRRSFSEEWQNFAQFLPEHESEFNSYFDIVEEISLATATIIDLGCGSGRWSAKLAPSCGAIVLVDFSDAIFVARQNLASFHNVLFFRGDITNLPFQGDCADYIFSLGVLHHLEQPCLDIARDLMRLAPEGLFYLYYAVDNRPWYFTNLLQVATWIRSACSKITSRNSRRIATLAGALLIYKPLIWLGGLLRTLGLPIEIPLYSGYRGKSLARIQQDVYDRLFTSIEQRVSREQILKELTPDFEVLISPSEPYWHFTVRRKPYASST